MTRKIIGKQIIDENLFMSCCLKLEFLALSWHRGLLTRPKEEKNVQKVYSEFGLVFFQVKIVSV